MLPQGSTSCTELYSLPVDPKPSIQAYHTLFLHNMTKRIKCPCVPSVVSLYLGTNEKLNFCFREIRILKTGSDRHLFVELYGYFLHTDNHVNDDHEQPEEEPVKQLTQDEILKLFSQVKGDKNRYKQILLNFLSNAVKFTKMGQNIHIYLTILEVHPKDARRMSIGAPSQMSGSAFHK